jgi:amino acid permease
MWFLIEGCIKSGTDNYGDLVSKVVGKWAGTFLNTVFIISAFGTISVYLIICSLSLPDIFIKFGMDDTVAKSNSTRIYIIIATCFLLLPLALKRKL